MLALDAPAHVRSRVTSIVDVVWEEYDVVIDLFSILFRLELDLVVILTIPNMLFFPCSKPEPKKVASSLQAALADGVASVFGGGKSEEKKEEKPRFSLSAVDNLIPKIRRGFTGEEEKDDAMVVGWKAEIRSRKEREEVLRYVQSRLELLLRPA